MGSCERSEPEPGPQLCRPRITNSAKTESFSLRPPWAGTQLGTHLDGAVDSTLHLGPRRRGRCHQHILAVSSSSPRLRTRLTFAIKGRSLDGCWPETGFLRAKRSAVAASGATQEGNSGGVIVRSAYETLRPNSPRTRLQFVLATSGELSLDVFFTPSCLGMGVSAAQCRISLRL